MRLLLISAATIVLAACHDGGALDCPEGSKSMDGNCVVDSAVSLDAGSELPERDLPRPTPTEDDSAVERVPDSGGPLATDSGAGLDGSTALCYLDLDGDGVGAGAPMNCPSPTSDAAAGDANAPIALVSRDGDCDDQNANRSPMLEEVCDELDNDCDGELDEETLNACGGPCSVRLEHQPGESCSNGLLGACVREGKYACQGPSAVACNAPSVLGSSELCGDLKDNDCDGLTDEPDAVDALFWYQDCDRDGFAASTTGAIKACTKPADAGSCTWTNVIPQPATKSNWDCDDSRPQYKPGAAFGVPPAGATSFDLDCNGTTEKESKVRKDGVPVYWCPASENGTYCNYWTAANGDNLSTQPACSATLNTTYPADYVDCGPGGVGFCSEIPYKGAQYCR